MLELPRGATLPVLQLRGRAGGSPGRRAARGLDLPLLLRREGRRRSRQSAGPGTRMDCRLGRSGVGSRFLPLRHADARRDGRRREQWRRPSSISLLASAARAAACSVPPLLSNPRDAKLVSIVLPLQIVGRAGPGAGEGRGLTRGPDGGRERRRRFELFRFALRGKQLCCFLSSSCRARAAWPPLVPPAPGPGTRCTWWLPRAPLPSWRRWVGRRGGRRGSLRVLLFLSPAEQRKRFFFDLLRRHRRRQGRESSRLRSPVAPVVRLRAAGRLRREGRRGPGRGDGPAAERRLGARGRRRVCFLAARPLGCARVLPWAHVRVRPADAGVGECGLFFFSFEAAAAAIAAGQHGDEPSVRREDELMRERGRKRLFLLSFLFYLFHPPFPPPPPSDLLSFHLLLSGHIFLLFAVMNKYKHKITRT